MSADREFLNDDFQAAIVSAFKTFPNGNKAATNYFRFFETDIVDDTANPIVVECIKLPIIAAPTTSGGPGGEEHVTGLALSGRGDAVLGIMTITPGATQDEKATYTSGVW